MSPSPHHRPEYQLTSDPRGQIFNLSERRQELSELNRRVSEFGWPETLAPPLDRLCSICKSIDNWTSDDPNNVAVLHSRGADGSRDRWVVKATQLD